MIDERRVDGVTDVTVVMAVLVEMPEIADVSLLEKVGNLASAEL